MSYDNRAPVAIERTLDELEVEGCFPAGLRGTLYRNGPNPLDPDPALHWFFGNGMVHAFHMQDGRVSYLNRWVRTRFWAQAAGEEPDGLPDGVANTSIVTSAGGLLALEEAHMPVALDRVGLATLGTEDFGGALPEGPFTAHPKTCPATGNLVFFGYGADGHFGDSIRLGEVAPDGMLLWHDTIHAPYGAMIHDFAVTARFIAIPLFPLVLDLEQGGFAWKPGISGFLGVIDRTRGVRSVRWIPLDGGFAFHVANAWDEGGKLSIDLMLSDAPPFFPGPPAVSPASTAAFLTRWQIDLAANSPAVETRRLSGTAGEFPRIDERWSGLPNRHVFWSTGAALRQRDDATGIETGFVLPDADSVSEPVFVSRGDTEGDGWLLAIVYRGGREKSDLVVLDARDLAAGPVALAKLPVRVPDGFHGAWVGDAP